MSSDQMTLPEPFDLPEPEVVSVDVSAEPDGSTIGTHMTVPRPVADRVQHMKHVATAARDSELAFTRTVLADLRKATQGARTTLTGLDAEVQAARAAGASELELVAITAIQRTTRQE